MCYSLLLITFVFLVLHDVLLSSQKWCHLFDVQGMEWIYQNPHNQRFLVAFVGMHPLILNYNLVILIEKRRWAQVFSCTGTKFFLLPSLRSKLLRTKDVGGIPFEQCATYCRWKSILQISPDKTSQRSETHNSSSTAGFFFQPKSFFGGVESHN